MHTVSSCSHGRDLIERLTSALSPLLGGLTGACLPVGPRMTLRPPPPPPPSESASCQPNIFLLYEVSLPLEMSPPFRSIPFTVTVCLFL